jgi:hypothetical protein
MKLKLAMELYNFIDDGIDAMTAQIELIKARQLEADPDPDQLTKLEEELAHCSNARHSLRQIQAELEKLELH